MTLKKLPNKGSEGIRRCCTTDKIPRFAGFLRATLCYVCYAGPQVLTRFAPTKMLAIFSNPVNPLFRVSRQRTFDLLQRFYTTRGIPPSPPVFSFTQNGSDCAWALDMAGGGAALFEIALVIIFGSIKGAGCGDFGGDGLAEFAAGLPRGF
jgi:hypothetical protein